MHRRLCSKITSELDTDTWVKWLDSEFCALSKNVFWIFFVCFGEASENIKSVPKFHRILLVKNDFCSGCTNINLSESKLNSTWYPTRFRADNYQFWDFQSIKVKKVWKVSIFFSFYYLINKPSLLMCILHSDLYKIANFGSIITGIQNARSLVETTYVNDNFEMLVTVLKCWWTLSFSVIKDLPPRDSKSKSVIHTYLWNVCQVSITYSERGLNCL